MLQSIFHEYDLQRQRGLHGKDGAIPSNKNQPAHICSGDFFFTLLNFFFTFSQHTNGYGTSIKINLIPDVVGFILIAASAHRLRGDSQYFKTVYSLSFPLMILSLPNLWQSTVTLSSSSTASVFTAGVLWSLLSIITLIGILSISGDATSFGFLLPLFILLIIYSIIVGILILRWMWLCRSRL